MHYFCNNLLKKGDNVLDIGANFGHYSIIFAKKIGITWKVYAIEPIKKYCKIIEHNKNIFNIKNIEVFNVGLGENSQKLIFGLPKSTPYKHWYTRVIPEEELKSTDMAIVEECFVVNPNDILKNLNNVNYIKCDVEGYEDKIIPLILDYLDKEKPILQIEISKKNCYLIYKQLGKINYIPYTLHRNKLINISEKNIEEYCNTDFIFLHSEWSAKIKE